MPVTHTSLDLREYQALVGKDLPQPEQFRYLVTEDAIRQFAYCIPDPNALYLDREYAATTRWRGLIAPPGYLYAHGSPAWLGKLPGIKDADGEELSQSDNATEIWEFFCPVRPGDIVHSYGTIASVEPKLSRKLGECALVTEAMRFTNQRGELVATLTSHCFRFNAPKIAAAGGVAQNYPPMPQGQTTRNIPTPPALPGTFPTPTRRYDSSRFFEEVREGEDIAPWELGPLMVSDMGRLNAATLGTGYDRIGRVGHVPDAFAPGPMRIPWFGAMLTRWGGPDCWVRGIAQRNQEWVLVGFRLVCGGRITRKTVADGRGLVELDIWCDSELGFRTNTGTARIELPRTGRG